MGKNRLEAFSDGVLAILITIMVLEMKVPHGEGIETLVPVIPVFLSRSISRNVSKVDGGVLGHENASKRCASLQAIGSEMERRWSASRPVLTRYKV